MCSSDRHADLHNLVLDLLSAFLSLRTCRLLRSSGKGKNLYDDLARLTIRSVSTDFDLDHIEPLLKAALADDLDDALIWDQVYHAVTQSTPPPRLTATSLQQTPWLHITGSFANSSEYRQDVDRVLRLELSSLYVGLRRFRETYFGSVAGLDAASEAVFRKCMEGSNPLFTEGGADGRKMQIRTVS